MENNLMEAKKMEIITISSHKTMRERAWLLNNNCVEICVETRDPKGLEKWNSFDSIFLSKKQAKAAAILFSLIDIEQANEKETYNG